MKVTSNFSFRSLCSAAVIGAAVLVGASKTSLQAATPTVLFQDDFTGGIPGWTAVRPAGGVYLNGPMLWEYDKSTGSYSEQSNIYTDAATFSSSRIAVMLINDTVAPANFTYTARLTAGDNDAFGLIWGYEDETKFYRVTFSGEARAPGGWPFQGSIVDRFNNGQITDIVAPSTAFVNTANLPFDVTITVNAGLLSLTVTNDPLGTVGGPTTIQLATDVPVPTSPSAKVGMFSWGQSGGIPRAFRIQNPILTPTPLTGNPDATVLTNWSFLVTPRGGDGLVPTAGLPSPIWAFGLDANGDRGAMIENSDWTFDNVLTATTNFAAPTAVAGNDTWSNYVYSARFLLNDDDGFGMLLRYQNETNFYRIAFRNQNSQSGIKRGLTVQKNVNLGFEQIYSNGVAGFIPPYTAQARSPFEVHAFIRTNRLQIIAIKAPDTAPSAAATGPIDMDITPSVLSTGKVGIFSWAMYADVPGTEVDWVKVSDVAGEGLLVSSPAGTPGPVVGLHDFPVNTVITATNELLINVSAGVRQTNTGWSGVGSVPATGFSNRADFTLTTFSSIAWKYTTQYLLTLNSGAGGTVGATLGPWVNANASVTVRATNNPGYVFTGWSGSSILRSSTNLTFAMIRPVTLTANFQVDSDNDGLPDPWELQYFGNLSQTAAADPDSDGISNLNEFLLGSNPNFAEVLASTDGLTSQWTNTCRDPALPGELTVVDFGSGYRGVFSSNNENKNATDVTFMPANNVSNFVSFQTQRLVVRSNVWNPTWGTNFSATFELTVGDDDGNCFYFRYLNESNWFRVTLEGQVANGAIDRPLEGLTVQRRTNGFHSDVPLTLVQGSLGVAYTDPTDGLGTPAGSKRLQVTISATNQQFEVRVVDWNWTIADFDTNNYLLVTSFTNTSPSLQGGRIGFGFWGQGGYANNSNEANGIPIPFGAMIDNIVVRSPADGPVVFTENWETAAMATNFPAGWTNPYTTVPNLAGTWVVNADGSISQLANQGGLTTGNASVPKADADANVLLAPDQLSANYYIRAGFHAFDNDGVGLVYDFQDTNNYSRIMLRQEATYVTDVPPGLSVSRKSGGVWTDVVAGDISFLYTPGRPFELTLGNNNGDYTLVARDLDNPATAPISWHWTGTPATAGNRFGITTWFSSSAHLLYSKAYSLPVTSPFVPSPGSLAITNITVAGGNVTLGIQRTPGYAYHVLRAANVLGPYVTNAAYQTAGQYIEPVPGAAAYYRLQYAP